jgi:branched-chain amino acid transport system substrate-binding protein
MDQRRLIGLAAALALALALAACGSNRSLEDIALAAQGIDPDAVSEEPARLTPAAVGATEGAPAAAATTAPTAVVQAPTPGAAASAARPVNAGAPGPADGATAVEPRIDPTSGVLDDTPAAAPQGGGGGPVADEGGPRSPIRIASVGALSGPAGAVLAPLPQAVQVWAAAVNARGGVNGHPVEVLVADDGGDPRRQREIVQQYVEQEGVIAFVAQPAALSQQGSIDYLERVGVPIVGTDGGNDYPYSRPIMRPQGAHGVTLARLSVNVAGQAAQARGLTRAGTILCVEIATCQAVRPQAEDVLPRYGVELVYNGNISLTQPDFTAECLNAASAGVEMFVISADSASIRRLAAACSRQGFRPVYQTLTTTLNDGVREDPNLTDLVLGSEQPVWTDPSIPAVAEMLDAYRTFAPGVVIEPTAIKGWTAAKLFEAATAALPEPATAQDVIDGLNRIRDDDLGGLTYPLTFVEGQPAPRVVCWFTVVLTEGQFVGGNDNAMSCE